MDLAALHHDARRRLSQAGALPRDLEGRGLDLEDALTLGLGLTERGEVLLPLHDLAGELIGLKGRRVGAREHKYFELPDGNGNPPWHAPDVLGATRALLWIEGELNAMVSALGLRGSGVGVIGLGSVFAEPNLTLARRLGVPARIYLDEGLATRRRMGVLTERAGALGVDFRRVPPLAGEWDACEFAGVCGRDALAERWLQLI